MASTFILDIETIPNAAMVECLPAPEVKAGNLKDPEKIAAKEAEARQKQIDGMALNPLWGRVCSYVLAEDETTCFCEVITEDSDAAETELLESLFKRLQQNVAHLVTYNGTKFDLPYIYKRAVALGVDTREYGLQPLREITDRRSTWHTDLMTAWCGFGEFESLDNISRCVVGDRKIEVDFHDFPTMIKDHDGRQKLAEYCRQDVMLTIRLYNRLKGIIF